MHGTALGVYGLWILFHRETERLFAARAYARPAAPRVLDRPGHSVYARPTLLKAPDGETRHAHRQRPRRQHQLPDRR
jgi:hypothetical protein